MVVCCREVEGPPPDDEPESDEDAVLQQQNLREASFSSHSGSTLTFANSGTKDPLGECECYPWVLIDSVSFLSVVVGL